MNLDDNYPHIAEFVDGWGWIEVGYDDGPQGFIRVLDAGGDIWESGDKQYTSLQNAFDDLEQFLTDWMDGNR